MFESIPFIHNIVNIYNLYYMCFISAWVCFFFSLNLLVITRTPQKTKTEPNKKIKPKQIKTKQKLIKEHKLQVI